MIDVEVEGMITKAFTRRQFIVGAGAAALSLPLAGIGKSLASDRRPNFVFILTDDQRYDAMSCAGHPFLFTPHTDRLANEGARFSNAFVTTSLCSPSRASFLTGQYAHSHGIMDNKSHLPDDILTFPQVLQKAGYDTAFVGKWHMDGQEGVRPGFNRWVGLKGQGQYYTPRLNIDGEKGQFTGYVTDLLTKYAVEWLKQPRQQPFCLYLSHKAVHGPFTPAVRHSTLFSDVEMPRPASDDMKGKPEWLKERHKTRHGTALDERLAHFMRKYNRTLVAVDDSVGRVLHALEELGVLDDTVVVFAGDNGYFQGEHGLLDKRAMYEPSIRIPLLMRYPKLVAPGTSIDQMVLNIDVCPTLLDLARAAIPQDVEGKSVRPLLSGRSAGWRSDFLYEYNHEPPFVTPTIRGVRTERWKYIEYPEIEDTAELYDLATDPEESHNRIDDPACAKVLAEMKSRLQELLAEAGKTD